MTLLNWIGYLRGLTNGWMDGWMNECIYEWVDRVMETFSSQEVKTYLS